MTNSIPKLTRFTSYHIRRERLDFTIRADEPIYISQSISPRNEKGFDQRCNHKQLQVKDTTNLIIGYYGELCKL